MKSSSYVIMWLTIFLVLILAMVLALVLLLLAELYCSPFIRRRHLPPTTTVNNNNNSSTHDSPNNNNNNNIITHAHPLPDIEKQHLPDQPSPENQQTRSLVYISNPIYGNGNGTPFETPESSPSRLETEDSSSGDDVTSSKVVVTLPVKKVKDDDDVGLVGISGSDTNGVSSSSCSLTTPCSTSPSL